MLNRRYYLSAFLMGCLLFLVTTLHAQVKVSGTVLDISKKLPVEAVSVQSNSGAFSTTDNYGRFSLMVEPGDSIWFSYLNKPTLKYGIDQALKDGRFEISLHVSVAELQPVMVRPRSYRVDSMQNRLDYAKAFDFQKPGIGVSTSPGGGVGLDINQFIQMFQFKRNKRMANFRDRLLREEEEKYILNRFSRSLIVKITGLQAPRLDSFIRQYMPPVEFVDIATEYEMGLYIQKCYRHFRWYEQMEGRIKPEDENP